MAGHYAAGRPPTGPYPAALRCRCAPPPSAFGVRTPQKLFPARTAKNKRTALIL